MMYLEDKVLRRQRKPLVTVRIWVSRQDYLYCNRKVTHSLEFLRGIGMAPSQWARVCNAEAHGLRRGAWYAVVNTSSNGLVFLDVNRQNRPVNRESLELTETQPDQWSVVSRDARDGAAMRASGAALGPTYGVCPHCRGRAVLESSDELVACPICLKESGVDWTNVC